MTMTWGVHVVPRMLTAGVRRAESERPRASLLTNTDYPSRLRSFHFRPVQFCCLQKGKLPSKRLFSVPIVGIMKHDHVYTS